MPQGPPAEFQDSIAPSQTPGDTNYTAPTRYDEHPDKSEYGPVTARFDDEITIERPAPDIETLRRETVHTAQLHHHNRERWNDWPFPNDTKTLYDLAVLDVMEKALTIEGLSPDDFEIPNPRFNFIFLKKARLPVGLKSFYAYIKSSKAVRAELGFPDEELPSYETLRQEANERFPDELDELEQGADAFEAAVVRTVYAVYRNGIDAPTRIKKAYGFDNVDPPLYERNVSRSTEKAALRNWVKKLIDETVDPLTFNRDGDPPNSFTHYLGLFATSAFCNCGFQVVPNVADYNYPRDEIPKGSGIGKYIRDENFPLDPQQAALKDSEIPALTEQFDAVHRNTFDVARQLGFFNGSQSLAVDLYHIEWDGAEKDVTINRPPKSENDIRSQWTYAALGIIDTDARFTLGARWLPDKSKYPDVIGELAPISNEFLTVEALYADSEIISGSLLDEFRGIAGSDWVVRAPDHDIVKKLKWFTPENHIGYVRAVPWNTTPKPNLVAYPYNSSNPSLIEFITRDLKQAEQVDIDHRQTFSDFSHSEADTDVADLLPDAVVDKLDDFKTMNDIGDTTSHAAYLTDRELPERSPRNIHFPYYQRWAIEQSINQIKNDTMPLINSSNEKLRLYGVNVTILFHNWHTLINRALSPELKLRLNVTHAELLKAIQDVAFSEPN